MNQIELAHTYVDDFNKGLFHQERMQSIEEYHRLGLNGTIGILVDDTMDSNFDPLKLMQELDFEPDYIALESKFSLIADYLFKTHKLGSLEVQKFPGKRVYFIDGTRTSVFSIDDGTEERKYTCATLSAAWHLVRAGYFYMYNDLLIYNNKRPKGDFHIDYKMNIKDNIISILPNRFRESEEKAKQVLISVGYESVVQCLKHIWF